MVKGLKIVFTPANREPMMVIITPVNTAFIAPARFQAEHELDFVMGGPDNPRAPRGLCRRCTTSHDHHRNKHCSVIDPGSRYFMYSM